MYILCMAIILFMKYEQGVVCLADPETLVNTLRNALAKILFPDSCVFSLWYSAESR